MGLSVSSRSVRFPPLKLSTLISKSSRGFSALTKLSQCRYTGQLSQSADSSPAEMMVRFPLSELIVLSIHKISIFILLTDKFGASDFVILDTDYLTYGLVCTCQGLELFFTYGHRRSCSILQRSSTEDPGITERMRDLLYRQIEDTRDDFNKINQEGCDYDKERLNIGRDLDQEVA